MYLALWRSMIYRFLSKLFLYPDLPYPQAIKNIFSKSVEGYISHFSDDVGAMPASLLLANSTKVLLELLAPLSLEELQAAHREIFGHIPSKDCPPYETQYGADLIFQQTQRLADISAFYKAFGLMLSDRAKERNDHISVEFEFMSFLCYKQEYASVHHGKEDVQICIDAQKEFIKSHLIKWAPAFTKLLRKKAQSELYQVVVDFVDAFLQLEAELLEIPIESLETYELKPASFEADGSCFSCGNN